MRSESSVTEIYDNNSERETKAEKLLHQIELAGGVEKERDGVKYFEVDSPTELFDWAVKNDLLLHGSPNLFKAIEPRLASDMHRPLGSLNAVYLSEFPDVSIAKTLIGESGGGYNFQRTKEGSYIADIYITDMSKMSQEGFMYIVDMEDVTQTQDRELVSFSPKTPLAIVRFTKDDSRYPIVERPHRPKQTQ
jgi:hypothetical protein